MHAIGLPSSIQRAGSNYDMAVERSNFADDLVCNAEAHENGNAGSEPKTQSGGPHKTRTRGHSVGRFLERLRSEPTPDGAARTLLKQLDGPY